MCPCGKALNDKYLKACPTVFSQKITVIGTVYERATTVLDSLGKKLLERIYISPQVLSPMLNWDKYLSRISEQLQLLAVKI